MRPSKPEDFKTGKFYRDWIRWSLISGVVFAILGVLNLSTTIYSATHHRQFDFWLGLIGTLISVVFLYRLPAKIRYIRTKWIEMNELNEKIAALFQEADEANIKVS